MEDNKKLHIGIIPDGNRRYSKKYGISLERSYQLGIENIIHLINYAKTLENIGIISIYALSKENLKRDKNQLNLLFKLFKEKIKKYINKKNEEINILFFGNIPEELKEIIEKIEENNNTSPKLQVNVLLGYSGRDEIINVIKNLKDIANLNEENFKKHLWIKEDVDLVIRTGGFQRLSNFLIYQTTYSELYFTPKLWNEFTIDDFDNAIKWFYSQKRNFGR